VRHVGVLLSGCGVHDGSDVQETVLLVLALRRRGARPVYLAPEVAQRDVVDHTTGTRDDDAQERHVLAEAARLARGVVRKLGEVSAADLDALVIPGGAGVVGNLCEAGERPLGGGPLLPEVGALLDDLAGRSAPVGAVGLAQVIVDRHRDRPLSNAAMNVPPREVVVDDDGSFLFTPGFMGGDELLEVSEGIDGMVDRLLGMAGPSGAGGAAEGS
jgi:enhancing lycopene biosynthesis protein 2